MRSEKVMIDLIKKFAEQDERIRAVGMNGSRTNLKVPKDPFQDYDIVYFVTDMDSFINRVDWIKVFGELIIMQRPDHSVLYPSNRDQYAYLMLFTDGNRIDLTLWPVEKSNEWIQDDKLAKVLLDKDHIFPKLPSPTDEDYWVKKPSQQVFNDCTNEFWWVSTYVAKGLWRNEILYAMDHLQIIRSMLLKMLEWKVGIETNFTVSIGKNGKYLERYLEKDIWNTLLNTYPKGNIDNIWDALLTMTNLFEELTLEVANQLQFNYSFTEVKKVQAYLKHVQTITFG
ncbi:aminoglycoside 6-adenylyltransferase [Ureibacillus sp. 179-F W5.1 NHS]|uniref:Aminoglycoside 6-adenylyltransferase n=1 Tax=Lysinibacillus halotolerans TaxID=1368476 RepID=A0A3M8HF63_9BACI|nr:aminoglycoside 6-adenylyltransferase [Lysinibacillus halotolerans]RND01118.1 aminoglycoside 6-adenylyltransferase [Lysinibacillus halotolerans]